jgi:hypothetical protein
METWHVVWALAAITGLVAAGLAGSLCAMITGERPGLSMLDDLSPATFAKGLALAIYAPLGLTRAGLGSFDFNPAFALLLLGIGTVWSFMQGVFIMVTFFGFT